MHIQKLGHCAMLIEVDGLRILTDPGNWSELDPAALTNIDLILITHEHQDHYHSQTVGELLAHNPKAQIVTNSAVGKILNEEGREFAKLEHGETNSFDGVHVEGFGELHAEIYEGITPAQNTGYLIGGSFFYPGDAFTLPGRAVEALALPVAGPWLHIRNSIDYALAVKPRLAFPVHDGMLKHTGPFHKLPEMLLAQHKIDFKLPTALGDLHLEL